MIVGKDIGGHRINRSDVSNEHRDLAGSSDQMYETATCDTDTPDNPDPQFCGWVVEGFRQLWRLR
jgi:hypothetical protein